MTHTEEVASLHSEIMRLKLEAEEAKNKQYVGKGKEAMSVERALEWAEKTRPQVGPWKMHDDGKHMDDWPLGDFGVCGHHASAAPVWLTTDRVAASMTNGACPHEDVEFIVGAREYYAVLAAEVRRLRAELEEAKKEAIKDCSACIGTGQAGPGEEGCHSCEGRGYCFPLREYHDALNRAEKAESRLASAERVVEKSRAAARWYDSHYDAITAKDELRAALTHHDQEAARDKSNG